MMKRTFASRERAVEYLAERLFFELEIVVTGIRSTEK
jgi:hypothetical protein